MKLKFIFIFSIALIITFAVGIIVGLSPEFKNKISIEKLFEVENKTIQSTGLPKPTSNPVSPLTVEQLFNIDTTVVKKEDLVKTIETYGDLQHPETDIKDITFKINGYVEKLYADYTGKFVKEGEPLLTVYSPELVSAQEEFLNAYEYLKEIENTDNEILKKTARKMYEASYKRLKYWDITDNQIERLKRTKKVVKTLTLYSPYDGWIMEKFINLGSEVKAGKPVLRLAKHKNLWLIAKIYEQDLPYIKEGQKVMVHFEAYPQKMINAVVDYVYPMMDMKNRVRDVRLIIPNPKYQFVPGMYSKVYLKVNLGKALCLPETAVINTGKRQIVFYEKEKGVFEPIFVKLGRYVDGVYEILKGVHEGMVVANSALFLLDADAQLRGKYRKFGEKQKPMVHHHH
jgi:Cu(I)/Ag(I) efflux system membrane fusion protein